MNTFKKEVWKHILPDGSFEEVGRDLAWEWEAEYGDGTILKQFGDDHIFHQTKDINTDTVKSIKIKSKVKSDSDIDFIWNHRKKFICFVRTLGLVDRKFKIRVHFFGYEELGVTYLLALFPDGRMVVLNDPDLLSVEFYD